MWLPFTFTICQALSTLDIQNFVSQYFTKLCFSIHLLPFLFLLSTFFFFWQIGCHCLLSVTIMFPYYLNYFKIQIFFNFHFSPLKFPHVPNQVFNFFCILLLDVFIFLLYLLSGIFPSDILNVMFFFELYKFSSANNGPKSQQTYFKLKIS